MGPPTQGLPSQIAGATRKKDVLSALSRWTRGQTTCPLRSSKSFAPVDRNIWMPLQRFHTNSSLNHLVPTLARSTTAGQHDGAASADLAQPVVLPRVSGMSSAWRRPDLVGPLGTARGRRLRCCPWRGRERRGREPATAGIAAHSVCRTTTLLGAFTSASACRLIRLSTHLICRLGYRHELTLTPTAARAWILLTRAPSPSPPRGRHSWTRTRVQVQV